jgi:hypothetical protein
LADSVKNEGLQFAAQNLGVLREGVFVLGDESEFAIIFDHAIYNYRVGGMNAVERFARESPPAKDTDEAIWLDAALRARYSMYLVVERIPGLGLHVRDVFSEEALLVADLNLSRTAPIGGTLAGRLVPTKDFWMTTGACLPVNDDTTLVEIGRFVQRTCPKSFSGLAGLSAERALLVESFITRTCLSSGAIGRMRFA